jgi:hypothetical protein
MFIPYQDSDLDFLPITDQQHCFLYLMERRETVHIGGVNVRPAAQQHLHLAAIPGRAGRQEHAPVAKSDLMYFSSYQLFKV